MVDTDDDPYELHARRFLDRLHDLSAQFSSSTISVEGIIQELDKCWPQILVAFWWAAAEGKSASNANDICQAFLACAEGDIVKLQSHRSSADVQRWSDSVAAYARQLRLSPNDAAYLYRFAGIAEVQRAILAIAEDTHLGATNVLRCIEATMNKGHSSQEAPFAD